MHSLPASQGCVTFPGFREAPWGAPSVGAGSSGAHWRLGGPVDREGGSSAQYPHAGAVPLLRHPNRGAPVINGSSPASSSALRHRVWVT